MFPDIPFDAVLADLLRHYGVTENADALGLNAAQVFRVTATEYLRLYDGVHQALADLRRAGYRLWLLSNAQRAFTAYELRALKLTDCFDGILLSSDYQCRKPDVRFFRALLETHGLHAENCLMIGNDRDTDIAGAQHAGIDTLYMHTNLTPAQQAPADPALAFTGMSRMGRHAEFEGADWPLLAKLLAESANEPKCV
jgi:putative hydrolase of the HAD superfamily